MLKGLSQLKGKIKELRRLLKHREQTEKHHKISARHHLRLSYLDGKLHRETNQRSAQRYQKMLTSIWSKVMLAFGCSAAEDAKTRNKIVYLYDYINDLTSCSQTAVSFIKQVYQAVFIRYFM